MSYNSLNTIGGPYDGYIQLKNEGLFIARIRLVYTLKSSKYRTSKTQKAIKGQTKKIVIPEGAHTIFYYIEYQNAIGTWKDLKSDSLFEPTIICFKTSGSLLNPKCEEIECSQGNDDSTLPSKPCCKCKCCCCRCNKK